MYLFIFCKVFILLGWFYAHAYLCETKIRFHHFKNYIIFVASDTGEATELLGLGKSSKWFWFNSCFDLIPVTILDWITMFYNGEFWLATLGHVSILVMEG